MKYSDYLKTDYWKAVSGAVKAKAKFKCQVCNSPHDLNAHHRSYDNRGNELNHLDDLICLCRRCHGIFHGKSDPEPIKIKDRERNGPSENRETMQQIRNKWVYDHEADMPQGPPKSHAVFGGRKAALRRVRRVESLSLVSSKTLTGRHTLDVWIAEDSGVAPSATSAPKIWDYNQASRISLCSRKRGFSVVT
jgi:hypothetical protein